MTDHVARRMPDWLFRRLDRIVRAQRRIRDEENRIELERQDREFRAYCDRQRAEHKVHEALGKRAADCPFVPCVPRVGYGVR
jgi:hypothetical protein